MRPSRTRHWVVVFAVTLAVVTYIDRVCISQAKPYITHDLGLSEVQMGYVFAAFGWAYALFEIPSGFLGDWMGPRRVLMRIVMWWSFFTAATGWAWSFASLVVTRFLFGAGEAGCFPNLTKAFTAWLPSGERVRAQGIMWLSARWGGAFTPFLVVLVLRLVGWRTAFGVFGLLGIVWAVIFYAWYRDNPRQKKSVNAAELELLRGAEKMAAGHAKVPWLKLLASPQAWRLCLQYGCLSYGWYFYITWLPSYLSESRHVDLTMGAEWSALLAGFPLFMGGIGCAFAGAISGPLARRLGMARTRRVIAYVGCLAAAVLLVISARLASALPAMLAMSFASFANDLLLPGSWGGAMDVGGRYAGTLSGAMNMFGNIGGAISPIATGYILSWTHNNWNMTFYVSAAIYVLGALCWAGLDPVTPLERES